MENSAQRRRQWPGESRQHNDSLHDATHGAYLPGAVSGLRRVCRNRIPGFSRRAAGRCRVQAKVMCAPRAATVSRTPLLPPSSGSCRPQAGPLIRSSPPLGGNADPHIEAGLVYSSASRRWDSGDGLFVFQGRSTLGREQRVLTIGRPHSGSGRTADRRWLAALPPADRRRLELPSPPWMSRAGGDGASRIGNAVQASTVRARGSSGSSGWRSATP